MGGIAAEYISYGQAGAVLLVLVWGPLLCGFGGPDHEGSSARQLRTYELVPRTDPWVPKVGWPFQGFFHCWPRCCQANGGMSDLLQLEARHTGSVVWILWLGPFSKAPSAP